MMQTQLESRGYILEKRIWNLVGLFKGRDVWVINGEKILYYASKDQMQGPWQGEVVEEMRDILRRYYSVDKIPIPYRLCKKWICFNVKENRRIK